MSRHFATHTLDSEFHHMNAPATGMDWRLSGLQDRYGDHFLPSIYERIIRLNVAWSMPDSTHITGPTFAYHQSE
jgi:hypothetical protein